MTEIRHIAGESETIEIEVTVSDPNVDPTGSSARFVIVKGGVAETEFSGSVAQAGGVWVATISIAKDATAAIEPGDYAFHVVLVGAAFRKTVKTGRIAIEAAV